MRWWPRPKGSDKREMAKDRFAVLAELGKLMEQWPGEFVDASLLPLPKDELKVLLRDVWREIPDETARHSIEVAYLHLRNFQTGIGPTPTCFSLGPDASPSEAARTMQDWLDWMHRTKGEAERLAEELTMLKSRNSNAE